MTQKEQRSSQSTAQSAEAHSWSPVIDDPLWLRTILTPRGLIFLGIFLIGFLLRWLELDARPVHHDESLHYMYGRYFFDFPEQNFHRYDPMLHGPVLYNLLRLVYNTLGSTTWSGRAFICVLGTLFMFVPLIFRRYFHRDALLVLTAAIALSPTLVYWSRFLREDYLMIWATLLAFYGVLAGPAKYRAFFVVLSIAIQWCIKANLFVHAAIILGFIVFEFAFVAVLHGLLQDDWKSLQNTMAHKILKHLDAHPLPFYCGLALGAFIYCYFYSSGFRYNEGIIDGLWRKSISYWMHQHNIERIAGPFMFHFYQLSWYELPFILVFLVALVHPYLKADWRVQVCAGLALLVSLTCWFITLGGSVEKVWPWELLRLKGSLDVFGACIIIFHSVLITIHHLLRKEHALAFFAYFFSAMLFTYSYLGEKVPWLATYPFLPGLIYLTLYFQQQFSLNPWPNFKTFPWSRVLQSTGIVVFVCGIIFLIEGEGPPRAVTQLALPGFLGDVLTIPGFIQTAFEYAVKNEFIVIGVVAIIIGGLCRLYGTLGHVNVARLALIVFCLYNIRASVLTNFTYAGEASEFISQVHTTKQLHNFVLDVRRQIEVPTTGAKPLVYVTGDATWPITWYLVDIPEYKFNVPEEELKNFKYRFLDWSSDQSKQIEGYKRIDLNLRGWWVPDYNQMTFRRYLHYAISHRPWSPVGYSYVSAYVKNEG